MALDYAPDHSLSSGQRVNETSARIFPIQNEFVGPLLKFEKKIPLSPAKISTKTNRSSFLSLSAPGPMQPGQTAVQILPPAAAPQGPAPHQRPQPPGAQERRSPAVRLRRRPGAHRHASRTDELSRKFVLLALHIRNLHTHSYAKKFSVYSIFSCVLRSYT